MQLGKHSFFWPTSKSNTQNNRENISNSTKELEPLGDKRALLICSIDNLMAHFFPSKMAANTLRNTIVLLKFLQKRWLMVASITTSNKNYQGYKLGVVTCIDTMSQNPSRSVDIGRFLPGLVSWDTITT